MINRITRHCVPILKEAGLQVVRVYVPNAVEYSAVGEDADVDVGDNNVVKVSFSLVGEEEIGHPDFVRVRQRKVFNFPWRKKGMMPNWTSAYTHD